MDTPTPFYFTVLSLPMGPFRAAMARKIIKNIARNEMPKVQKGLGCIWKERKDRERMLWEAIDTSECIRTKAALLDFDLNLSRNIAE